MSKQMKSHKEAHDEWMKDWRYRFWWYLYWPYFKIIIPLWVKLKHSAEQEQDDE